MYIKEQSFLILGASKSGVAVAEYLLKNGCKNFCVYEQFENNNVSKNIELLHNLGANILSNEEVVNALDQIDLLVISPGIPINHPICVKAKEMGKRIIGEVEFAFNVFIPPIIAVTGTNGKTTTVSLINEIFRKSGINSSLVGNVGVPFTKDLCGERKTDVYILEVSSFQLESTYLFAPHVSCILNLAPDHLDRHYTMENYTFLKKKIFKNQRESEFVVLNYDDKLVKNFASELRAKPIWVSTKQKVDGAYSIDGKLYYKDEFIIEQKDLAISGEHNVYNSLFAIASARLFGIDVCFIKDALSQFKGVKNRMEFIGEFNGVKFINDSKATNTASTISAIETLKIPTVLILGGYDKKEDYTLLFEKIKSSPIKHVILTGDTRFKMLNAAGKIGVSDVTVTADFDFAVKISKMIAESNDLVLLSPACSSFDRFSSYEERGDRFRKIVENMGEKFNIT